VILRSAVPSLKADILLTIPVLQKEQRVRYEGGGTAIGSLNIGPLDASKITSGTLDTARIPNLDATKITTGQLALARGGTHADLSGTGGTSRFLRQNSSGADITVVQPATTDLSDIGNFALLKLLSTNDFNDGTNHTAVANIAGKSGTILIGPQTAGMSGDYTEIPFYSNRGSGVAFVWSFLDPDTGWTINGNGTFSFTDGSALNTYSIALNSGSGNVDIQRTAGSTAYRIRVYTLSF